MVEGAKIDHAHHATYANLALEETLVLDKAVEKALEKLKNKGLLEDTLVIVTADHSHTMSLPGYPTRGSDIKGLLGKNEVNRMPEINKIYANGPQAIPVCLHIFTDLAKLGLDIDFREICHYVLIFDCFS